MVTLSPSCRFQLQLRAGLPTAAASRAWRPCWSPGLRQLMWPEPQQQSGACPKISCDTPHLVSHLPTSNSAATVLQEEEEEEEDLVKAADVEDAQLQQAIALSLASGQPGAAQLLGSCQGTRQLGVQSRLPATWGCPGGAPLSAMAAMHCHRSAGSATELDATASLLMNMGMSRLSPVLGLLKPTR